MKDKRKIEGLAEWYKQELSYQILTDIINQANQPFWHYR